MVSSGGDMSSSEAAPAVSSTFSSTAAGASAGASAEASTAAAAAGALFTGAGEAFLGIDEANMPMVDGYLLWDGIDRAKRVSE
jgi:hypothetical protein